MSRLPHDSFVEMFDRHFHRLYRYLDRLSGEPDLARDLAQDTFVRLYERGSLPERPEAWLVTVATNLLRNSRGKRSRRSRILSTVPPEEAIDEGKGAWRDVEAEGTARHVRAVLGRMAERDRRLLLLRAEGFAYREIAEALDLNEASVGTLLARAKRAFSELYEGPTDAPR